MFSVACAPATDSPGVIPAPPIVPGPPPGRSTEVWAGTAITTGSRAWGSEISTIRELDPIRTDHTIVPGAGETDGPLPNRVRRTGATAIRVTIMATTRPTTTPPAPGLNQRG